MEELVKLDVKIFIYLNNLGTPAWDGFWLFMTNKFYQIPLYLILLSIFYKHFKVRGTIITLVLVALLITTSDQLSNLFKNVLFMIPRPCRVEELQGHIRFIAERCGRHGFFSGHAASSMALAFFTGLTLYKHIKFIFPFMIVWSVVVSYSRIYIGVHYPSDIIVGMLIGMSLGFMVYKLHNYFIKKYGRL